MRCINVSQQPLNLLFTELQDWKNLSIQQPDNTTDIFCVNMFQFIILNTHLLQIQSDLIWFKMFLETLRSPLNLKI